MLEYKRRTREMAGEQLYLDDPPHATLYLALFDDASRTAGAVREFAAGSPAPSAGVDGWHVFEGDVLTGRHTLTCELRAADRVALGKFQERTVRALSPLRDAAATRARYDASWPRLAEAERANVLEFGFPYVGPIWHAHITIASIWPDDWSKVWGCLKESPPSGRVRFTRMNLYRLDGLTPVVVETFSLRVASGECDGT